MKKMLCMLLSVGLLLSALPFATFAADTPTDLPYLTNQAVVFMDYNGGSNDLSGATAASAKKSFGEYKGNGAIGVVPQGGTVVLSGKAYVGGNYTLNVPGTVLFTSLYNGVDYMQKEPVTNPNTAFKIKAGVNFTIASNAILDHVILFQEADTQNAITVEKGATLVIGANIVTMSKTGVKMKIVVESGGRLILGGGDFEVENRGGEVYSGYTYEYSKVVPQTEEQEDYSDRPAGVAYIDYNKGANTNDGLSADTAKKQLLFATENGALSSVLGGGVLVASGRMYIGSDYTIPKLGGYLTITGEYNGVSYVNHEPANNPSGGMIKMLVGKTLTIGTDARMDNIIIFQEGTMQNTIRVGAGATVTFGKGVECLTVQPFKTRLFVEAGGIAVFEGENPFESVEGDGIVVFAGAEADKFAQTRIYTDSFADVAENQWFHSYVKTAYEYGLANGTSATKFSPDGNFTVAQALTAAANIHTIYTGKTVRAAATGEAWYAHYVEYCVENGIITANQFADYNKNITRGEMAIVFANILPAETYTAVRDGACADVPDSMACAAAVQKLYRAGIVGGDAGTGKYRPNESLKRSEACVIFTRIAVTSMREGR